jgi:hypothetical protein
MIMMRAERAIRRIREELKENKNENSKWN